MKLLGTPRADKSPARSSAELLANTPDLGRDPGEQIWVRQPFKNADAAGSGST